MSEPLPTAESSVQEVSSRTDMVRRNLLRAVSVAALGGIAATGYNTLIRDTDHQPSTVSTQGDQGKDLASDPPPPAQPVDVPRVAADPTNIPAPVDWQESRHHQVTLEVVEVVAEIEPGVTFNYMTFDGQIPGPMIRVRQGDTIDLVLKNPPESVMPHSVDLHAVYGTGGGAVATNVSPGQSNGLRFKAMYPGAFIYHCAIPVLDYHISSGMFGMILVEPPEGLPPVDHEFYLGQHEVYTDRAAGEKGHHNFDFQAMSREDPTYVLLNGEKYALTTDRHGPMVARVGETARVFFVCGGPNLSSHFHPIGNVWAKAWREGALLSTPERYVQTMTVPPGSCGVFEMEFPVPQEVKLVDHALTRVARKGMMGAIVVEGAAQPDIYSPDLPGDAAS